MGQFVNLSFWFDTFLDWTDLNFRKHSSLKQFSSRCAPWVVLVLLCFIFLGVVSLLGVTGFGRFLSWFVCHVLVSVRELHFPACSPQPFTKDNCFHGPGKFGVCLQWHRSRRYFQRTLNCKKKQSWHLQQWQSFVPHLFWRLLNWLVSLDFLHLTVIMLFGVCWGHKQLRA